MEDYCRNTLDKSVASYIKGIDIMWQLAYVIDYLHRLGVNPGDLMLENVLLWKKNPESRRVFVKLSGYGYSNNRFEVHSV
jgi:serine/threonine protein kinase